MTTRISDIIVPENFASYIQQESAEKSRLIASGALVSNPLLDAFLAGEGVTTRVPSFRDLDNDADEVATDTIADMIALSASGGTPAFPASFGDSTPGKIQTSNEIAVRLSRNKSWSSMDLAAALAGSDPLDAIESRAANYWRRRLQAIFVATMNGVLADNIANDGGDYVNDISGASYVAGVTDFSAEAVVDTSLTMGDSMDELALIMVHSVVYARMKKNDLIDFIPDSEGKATIPTFQGLAVIVDDGMPNASQVYDSWLFGPGACQLGQGSPKEPVEVERKASAGNGSGQDVLHTRTEYAVHPVGHAYNVTPPDGGPDNTATGTGLAAAASWNRVYPERKQIPFACLKTREA